MLQKDAWGIRHANIPIVWFFKHSSPSPVPYGSEWELCGSCWHYRGTSDLSEADLSDLPCTEPGRMPIEPAQTWVLNKEQRHGAVCPISRYLPPLNNFPHQTRGWRCSQIFETAITLPLSRLAGTATAITSAAVSKSWNRYGTIRCSTIATFHYRVSRNCYPKI